MKCISFGLDHFICIGAPLRNKSDKRIPMIVFPGIYQTGKHLHQVVNCIVSLVAPGFALLVNFVVKGAIITRFARTCAQSQGEDLPLNPACVTSLPKSSAYYFCFYLRLSVGSEPLGHSSTQKEHWGLPQVSPSLQPHTVSVVAVQTFRVFWAPKHARKNTEGSCSTKDFKFGTLHSTDDMFLYNCDLTNAPTYLHTVCKGHSWMIQASLCMSQTHKVYKVSLGLDHIASLGGFLQTEAWE